MEELEAEKGLEWHPFLRNEKRYNGKPGFLRYEKNFSKRK